MFSALAGLVLPARLGILALVHVVVFVWVWFIVGPARVGLSRLVRSVLLLPVLALPSFLFDPYVTTDFTPAAYCVIIFLWLTPCKIYAFCTNRGQLVKSYDCEEPSAFFVGLLFPITVAFKKERIEPTEETAKQRRAYRDARFAVTRLKGLQVYNEAAAISVRIVAKLALIAALGYLYRLPTVEPSSILGTLCLGLFAYANISGIEDLASFGAVLTTHLKLEPNYDMPFLAGSVQELWSRRHNVVFSTAVRNVSYEPIYEGCWVKGDRYFDRKSPSCDRKKTAVMACFLLSGLFHQFVFAYGYAMGFTPLHILFFLGTGLAVLLERFVEIKLHKSDHYKWLLTSTPFVVKNLYCAILVSFLTQHLMWPEMIKGGYADGFVNCGLSLFEAFGFDLTP